MPQSATTFAPAPHATAPSVADALAAITEAGRTIADLRARLAEAERAVAALRADKRLLKAELRAVGRGGLRLPPPDRIGEDARIGPQPNHSHLDDALAAVLDGLGPNLVRRAP